MSARTDTVRVLLRIAFRNLFASRVKTLIVGGIIVLGATITVFGSALVDSLVGGMRRSIQGSLSGHIQVYSSNSRDEIALFGGMGREPDLDPMEDFAVVKRVVAAVPNVKAVVPMGVSQAFVSSGNQFDRVLAAMRDDLRAGAAGDRGAAGQRFAARRNHLRRMIGLLRTELTGARTLIEIPAAERAERARDWADLEKATTDEFWRDFDRDPLAGLEFLENRIAPQQVEGGFTFIRYVGTDIAAFQAAFDRLKVVEGAAPLPGERGVLIGRYYSEQYLKLKQARRLDRIREARERGRTIGRDEELQRWVKENTQQTRELLLQMDEVQAAQAGDRLRRILGTDERDLKALLVAFFQIDDRNFEERYQAFYSDLVPLLQLYLFKVGDTITIKAPSKSGYMNSINVPVRGVVEFTGLEKSNLASITCLLDLQSFRDLYGYLTPEKRAEIHALKAAAGMKELSRESAEAELFGSAPAPAVAEKQVAIRDVKIDRGRPLAADLAGLTPEELERGVALNAAVILSDPSRLIETQRAIQAAADAAKLPLRVVDWKTASGNLGKTMTGLQAALYGAAFIIFAVAIVIMNNAMVMATLQRVKEIGTMRAIGAQRRFVLAMMLVEAVVLGVVFGLLGGALGAGLVWLSRAAGGFSTSNDQLQFLFSGPALLPELGGASLGVALTVIILVSIASGFYPALLAMRVTPLEAMQTED
jgi:ABC-type lipoprotein release transport system permease subunit